MAAATPREPDPPPCVIILRCQPRLRLRRGMRVAMLAPPAPFPLPRKVQRMLKESIDLHRQGRFDEAEQGYRRQLAENPDDVDALHLLGMLRHQRGDAAEGAHLLGRVAT